jgi:anthranilate synthase component I
MTALTIHTLLSDSMTPVSCFSRLQQEQPLAFLFESADGDKRMARFSMMGVDPLLSVSIEKGQTTVTHYPNQQTEQHVTGNPLAFLKQLGKTSLPTIHALPDNLKDIPFSAGWVGYLGYGMSQYFEQIPQPDQDVLGVPNAFLGLYDSVVVFDHLYRRLHFISHRNPQQAEGLWKTLCRQLTGTNADHSLEALVYPVTEDETELFGTVSTSVTKAQYCQSVDRVKQFILEGQAFQIVLAQRFYRPVTCNPLSIYRMVQAINPSPYAYFLKYPGFSYLGSSPETFIQCQQSTITLRALAGTRHRGKTLEEDEQLAKELQANAKEMAEHRMLVDLARNDLGRVCEPGQVEVGEIAQVLKYSHVMHLATAIHGTLKSTLSGYEAIQSCFPRGTVSGAPKIRAMNLLAQLETEQRGIYSGMVGYIDHQGNTDGAIAIRSALVKDGMAHVHAGAGIVHYSDREAEYEETRNKAKSIIQALHLAEKGSRL